jgi:hypothetical protein
MMCLACEQDAVWLDYLESKGLLKADDPAAVEALFAAFPMQPLPMQPLPMQPLPMQSEQPEQGGKPANAPAETLKNPFSCDDPTAE